MLNYDDSDQTLLSFYHTTDLASPVSDKSSSIDTSDPQALNQLPLAQQLDVINDFLTADRPSDYKLSDHDHRDPLDGSDLVRKLVKKGSVSSESDPALTKFLVSSQQFDATTYLSVVHENTPIEQLAASLNALDATIRYRTNELKSVLHDNFESFLTCKKSIDGILASLRDSKSRAQQDLDKSKVFNPAARRNKKKLDESSTLLSELEESINNLNLSSSLMIRPIMDHNAKEAKIKALMEFIQANKFMFDLPKKFVEYLSNQDHDSLVSDYNRFLTEKEEIESRQSRELAKARASGDDAAIQSVERKHTMQNTALTRVFKEISTIAEEYRKKCLSDLLSMDHEVNIKSNRKLTSDVKFIDLVKKLHRMDTPGSSATPIYDFLSSQLDKIESELLYQHEKFKSRFSAMQKKLLDYITSLSEQRSNGSDVKFIAEKFDSVEEFFKASSSYTTSEIGPEKERIIVEIFENNENLDLSIINETWLVLSNYIRYLEEFSEFKMAKFVKNYLHYAGEQNGYNVDSEGVLKNQFFRILNEMIGRITDIFSAQTTTDQMKVTPANYSAFLPYHTNSLSAIFYLTAISKSKNKLFTTFGTYTTEIGNLSKSAETNKRVKSLKEASEVLDLRFLEAICATWVNDCSQFYDLENWEKYKASGDKRKRVVVHTKSMQLIYYYELFVLEKLENLLSRKTESLDGLVRIVSSYPSKKVLMSLEIQFMRSMNVLIDSSVKKFAAEKASMDVGEVEYETEQCIYKVLTMNNFTALGELIFPKLISKFDALFEKTLSKQNLKLFADLDKVKITILDDINEIEKAWIESKIEKHFKSVQRSGSRRQIEIDPFVYHCLLHFVKLLHVLKPITDMSTFVAIMQQLQTQFLIKFLQCLREASEKEQVIVRILGNMKLDLDFFVEVFEASDALKLDEYCLNLVQIILGQIDKVEKMFSDLGYTQNDIDQKLYEALQNSGNEFTCFT